MVLPFRLSSPLSVLCLGAHPDDIEIGCGGTLLTLAQRPDVSVVNLVLTGSGGREDEARAAGELFAPGSRTTVLGLPDGRLPSVWGAVKEALEDQASVLRPDVVLCPRVDDAHQDHRLLGRLVSTAWRDSLVMHYEIPKWDGDLRPVSHYVQVAPELAHRKAELLDRAYPSQRGRDWWDAETFLSLMRIRGVECRARYAEGFVVSKAVVDVGP
ncbi:PIG-L deacetylase family protein [Monashia sp. NPDC004114]